MNDISDMQLAAQYEAYPYPERNPRDEARRLIVGSPGNLGEIDYWVFGANRPASQPLRALIAGGGTGDGTIMLATQMAWAGRAGTVTYLDRSAASLAVARARAGVRGLTNIDFRLGSLLDLPKLGLGLFDYIDCCGVLHHLPQPAAGLEALLGALAPGGGMGLMVYAPHGRTGVYMLQDALRLLAPATEPPAARLDVARRVMRNLPASAWLRANQNFADHICGGDAGLYDLLLNPRDRAYDVPRFVALLARSGLAITCLVEPMRYDPTTYLPDVRLRALAAAMDPIARATLAEALCGNINTHVAYVRRASEPMVMADPMADSAVPVAPDMSGIELAQGIRADGVIAYNFRGLSVPVAMPSLAGVILRRIDGIASVSQIEAGLGKTGISPANFRRAWAEVWGRMSALNCVLLAAPP